jgi:hypothetical protein
MNPQETQMSNPQMSPDESAASLTFATQLQEQMMPDVQMEEPVEAPMEGQMPQGEEQSLGQQEDAPMDLESLKEEVLTELQAIKEEIKLMKNGDSKDEKSEISALKKEIEAVLNSDE